MWEHKKTNSVVKKSMNKKLKVKRNSGLGKLPYNPIIEHILTRTKETVKVPTTTENKGVKLWEDF